MKKIAIAIAALGLVAGTASAAPNAAYRGKTKGGSSITFSVAGKRISQIRTIVPTICVETTGSYKSRAGGELYQPPGSFAVGTTAQVKALQPAAMNKGTKATKTYTFTSSAGPGGSITGKLRVSFSFITLGLDAYHSYIWLCTGTTTFSASAR